LRAPVEDDAAGAIECALRSDPALTLQFTPRWVPPGTYVALTTSAPIDDVLRCYSALAPDSRVPTALPMQATDLFGIAAPFERTRLARVFGAERPLAARFPVRRGGRVVQSVTVASPYPDAALTHLVRGTLVIVFFVPDLQQRPEG
jgi:hypothetical protein